MIKLTAWTITSFVSSLSDPSQDKLKIRIENKLTKISFMACSFLKNLIETNVSLDFYATFILIVINFKVNINQKTLIIDGDKIICFERFILM